MEHETTTRDRGAALLLAIVVVTGVSVAIAAALGFAATSVSSSANSYRPARHALYGADAAVKVATNYLAANPSAGTPTTGGGCQAALDVGTLNGAPVSVQVCAEDATSFEPISSEALPFAILALPASGENGVEASTSGPFFVDGNVYSTGDIEGGSSSRSDRGIRISDGVARSEQDCDGYIYEDGTRVDTDDCEVDDLPDEAADPSWSPAVTTRPADADTSGRCDDDIAVLEPGTYVDEDLSDAIDDCDNVWMQPGTYYFEDVAWTVNEDVIGGTLAGGATDANEDMFDADNYGAACDPDEEGVQIILGGESRFTIGTNDSLQLCGAETTQGDSTVRVPLYGLPDDVPETTITLTPTTATDPDSYDWTNRDRALTIANTTASEASITMTNTSRDLTLSGFGSSSTIPSGTTLTLAYSTRVSNTSDMTLTALVTSSNGETCQETLTDVTTSPPATQTVSVNCAGFDAVAPLSVRVRATASHRSNSKTAYVDGIELRYTAPGMKGQDGCIVETSGDGCNVLAMTGNDKLVWLSGSSYLPLARIEVQAPSDSAATLGSSLVVRSIKAHASASTQLVPVVGDTTSDGTLDGHVVINGIVDGTSWLSARVYYTSSGSSYAIDIQTWIVRR
ncbi:MAG: hypothetical protein RLZ04_1495 [Actinomycetota bacterium]